MSISPDQLLATAVEKNIDVDKLGQLLDLKERYDAAEARKAFAVAMAEVQAAAPVVEAKVKNEQAGSKYADLSAILTVLAPLYTEAGFALSFGQGEAKNPEHIRVDCLITHKAGHSENRWVELPYDMTGLKGTVNKTGVHAAGSTLSYARRYLTCLIFHVATEDDDGQSAGASVLENLTKHNEAVRDEFYSIYACKKGIADHDYGRAIEAMDELSNEVKVLLHLAPTKGGIFTTAERNVMKSDEWAAERRAWHDSKQEQKDAV